jgi:beta-lactamase superfamily II metal-dependent hydrolase
MVEINFLAAGHGDCIWIEYRASGRFHRILVDAGTYATARKLSELLDVARRSDCVSHELFVVTHLDSDHIGGALKILDSPVRASQFEQIWFNGRHHLDTHEGLEQLGVRQAEQLSSLIQLREIPWNTSFCEGAVACATNGVNITSLPGGAKVTILSPTEEQLTSLAKVWDKEVRKAQGKEHAPVPSTGDEEEFEVLGTDEPDVERLASEQFIEDAAPANGSSIAMLVEINGKKILLGADAHPTTLVHAIQEITGGGALDVDVFKLPHHGSKYNLTSSLLQIVRAKEYVFLSNGAYFGHPDAAAVAKVIKYAPPNPRLVFNYRSQYNKIWESRALQRRWGYRTLYGDDEKGVALTLMG